MKLRVSYRKFSDGGVEAKILVIDKEDYPTSKIFNDADNEDFNRREAKEHFTLGDNNYHREAYGIFNTPVEATEEVKKFIEKVKRALEAWRTVQLPKNFEITI